MILKPRSHLEPGEAEITKMEGRADRGSLYSCRYDNELVNPLVTTVLALMRADFIVQFTHLVLSITRSLPPM